MFAIVLLGTGRFCAVDFIQLGEDFGEFFAPAINGFLGMGRGDFAGCGGVLLDAGEDGLEVIILEAFADLGGIHFRKGGEGLLHTILQEEVIGDG